MTRLLAATALTLGLLAPAAPAANACDWEHCPGTSTVCQVFGCPIYCTYVSPLGRTVCIGN